MVRVDAGTRWLRYGLVMVLLLACHGTGRYSIYLFISECEMCSGNTCYRSTHATGSTGSVLVPVLRKLL